MGKPRKKKVAVVTPGTFAIPSEHNSSVEKVVMNVCTRLHEHVDFLLISKKTISLPVLEKRNGIQHYRPRAATRRQYMHKLMNRIRRFHPDIIQVENRPRIASFIKRKFTKHRVWLSLHSTTFMTPPHISLTQLRKCLADVERIIVNSFYLRERLSQLVPSSASKITVNHLGVDPSSFPSRWDDEGERLRSELVKQLGYEGKKTIVFAGRLIPEKGVHHLLHSLPEIIRAHSNAVLIIVGGAAYGKNNITPYVSKLHQIGGTMPAHVLFVPFQSYSNMASWYRLADIVAVPSFKDEAFGLVIVEAMASGACVVATEAGGMKEIIDDGRNGVLIPLNELEKQLGSVVIRLLDDPDVCRQLGEQGAAHIRDRFTWKHTADRWLTMYNQ